MRDQKTTDEILSLLQQIWKIYPDLRLGQILVCADLAFEKNPFYFEDEAIKEGLKNFLKKTSGEQK